MNVKQILDSHFEINKSIDSKLEQIAELRSLAEKITAGLPTESRGSGGYTDRVGRTAARIIDLENEVNDEIDRLVDVKAEIIVMIGSLTDSIQKTILERHYILHEGWEKIAEKLGYSPRHVARLHAKAIAALEEMFGEKTA